MCISFGLIFCTKNEILSTKAACPFSKRRRRVMKKMTRRRITALFMAVLMVVGILPLSMLTGIFSSKAQARTVTASIDLSKGLKAGTVYGDESIVKLEVLIDMPVKEGSGATVEGVKYDAFIQQPKVNPKPNNGAVPTEGAAFKMTAVADSKITFVTKAASGKKMYFVENSHPAIVTKEVFKAAQVERTKRNMKSNDEKEVVESHHQNRYSSKNPLSNKIICSECGALYRRAVWTKRNKEKEPVWRCSNRLKNGKAICPNSVTLKEKPLMDALTSLINGKTKSKEKTRLELAKELSEYLNPKDIIEKKQKLNCELENVNSQINELLDKGMLLVARGVQDESQIEEHLAQCYQTKQMLKKELQKLDDKYNALKQGRQEKLLKTLEKNSNEHTVMTQEDLAVFIDRIVVKKDKIEIETIDDQKCELLLNQIS